MPGTLGRGIRRAPAMTAQQPIDRAVIDLVPDLFFKGVLDLGHRGDLSADLFARGTPPLRGTRQILMPPASFAWRFQGCRSQGCRSQAIVG